MAKSAILKVDIISDARKASAGFDSTASKIKKFQKNLDKAALVAGGALAGVGALAKSFFDAAEASGTADARIGNIVNSMGNFGAKHQQVSDRIVESANKMARSTGIDPNAIKQGQAILSTFDTIVASADQVGGAFDRATKLSADLSAAGFGSVESSAQMLGKALADPTRGMTALRRVGVNLTAQQEEQVKAMQAAGDMAGAQNIILSAVEKQVGGTAEATANASDKAKVAWQQAKEKLGETLMPAFERLTQAVEHASDFIGKHSGAVATLMGIVAGFAAVIITASAAMKVYAAAQTAVAVAKGVATAAQWALNVAMSANPIGLIIIGIAALIAFIAALVAGIIWAWKNVEWFRNGILAAWQFVKTAAAVIFEGILATIRFVWEGLKFIFFNFIPLGVIIKNWETIKETTTRIIGGALAWLTAAWNKSTAFVKTTVTKAVNGVVTGWTTLQNRTTAAFAAIVATVRERIARVLNTLTSLRARAGQAIAAAWNFVVTTTANRLAYMVSTVQARILAAVYVIRSIPSRVRSALGNLGSLLVGSGRALIDGFISGIRNSIGRVANAARDIVSTVRGYFPFSPAKTGPLSGSGYVDRSGDALVSDFAEAMANRVAAVKRASRRVAEAVHFDTAPASTEIRLTPASAASAGGVTFEAGAIQVNSALDGDATAGAIVDALDRFFRRRGTQWR